MGAEGLTQHPRVCYENSLVENGRFTMVLTIHCPSFANSILRVELEQMAYGGFPLLFVWIMFASVRLRS